MYVDRQKANELIKGMTRDLVTTLNENQDLLSEFSDDDDWSFVIKLHAFIESMVTSLILAQINDERLKVTIERLPLSDEQAGKLTIARDLELLDSNERRFIRYFSNLRNMLAHNIENRNFTFESHLATLDKNQKKAFADSISWFADKDTKDYYQRNALSAPRSVIYIGISVMSSLKIAEVKNLKTLRELNTIAEETTKQLLDEPTA